jgi:hypothetical protein
MSDTSFEFLVSETHHKKQQSSVNIYEVKFSWEHLMSMSVAECDWSRMIKNKYTSSDTRLEKIRHIREVAQNKMEMFNHRRVCNYFKIYTQFLVMNNQMFIAHANFISSYDLIEKKFRDVLAFDSKIDFLVEGSHKDAQEAERQRKKEALDNDQTQD